MQIMTAYTESFCIIAPGGYVYRRVLYKYMLALIFVSATSSNSTQVNADKEARISVNLRESVPES